VDLIISGDSRQSDRRGQAPGVFPAPSPARQSVEPEITSIECAMRRSPCHGPTSAGEHSARSIRQDRVPTAASSWPINSGPPHWLGNAQPPSETQPESEGHIGTGIRWQTSVRNRQVDTKSPAVHPGKRGAGGPGLRGLPPAPVDCAVAAQGGLGSHCSRITAVIQAIELRV